jgi:hypothetical protein
MFSVPYSAASESIDTFRSPDAYKVLQDRGMHAGTVTKKMLTVI